MYQFHKSLLRQPTYGELIATIAELRIKIASLESELARYKTPKNSGNSHLPPSTDIVPPVRNKSLREKSEKKPGGQSAHDGNTLQIKEYADEVIEHIPCYCSKCGKDLKDISEHYLTSRQVIDIPPIKPIYKEHRVYGKTCCCGHTTENVFPQGVNSAVQYGGNTEAMIAYLYARQYLPFERMAEFFNHTMGLPISTGCIANIVQRFADKAQTVYKEIKTRIEQSTYLGTDETGIKVNGNKDWFWTWQNERLTYIIHSTSRGYDTIEQVFPKGLPNTILQHDRWGAHFKCKAQNHQICMSHLLRDLNYINDLYESKWAYDFKVIIKEALLLNEQTNNIEYKDFYTQREMLKNRLHHILEQPVPSMHIKAKSLQKSLCKIKNNILLFLYHTEVPSDNNGSERAIRNVKVKQKISGQFKSVAGAKAFATIRSIIDTTIKSGQQVFNALFLIANLTPT